MHVVHENVVLFNGLSFNNASTFCMVNYRALITSGDKFLFWVLRFIMPESSDLHVGVKDS